MNISLLLVPNYFHNIKEESYLPPIWLYVARTLLLDPKWSNSVIVNLFEFVLVAAHDHWSCDYWSRYEWSRDQSSIILHVVFKVCHCTSPSQFIKVSQAFKSTRSASVCQTLCLYIRYVPGCHLVYQLLYSFCIIPSMECMWHLLHHRRRKIFDLEGRGGGTDLDCNPFSPKVKFFLSLEVASEAVLESKMPSVLPVAFGMQNFRLAALPLIADSTY